MRLEVLLDQAEPKIYQLNKDRILIGSGAVCDILLEAEGISRKHLMLSCSDDEFFIIDQGSTNGSFINDERLIPGKRVEFTTFFPVRLAESVVLTLLTDEETSGLEISPLNSFQTSLNEKVEFRAEDEGTRIIKRADIRNNSSLNINLHSKKSSVRAKRSNNQKSISGEKKVKRVRSKPEKNLTIMIAFSVILTMAAIYYHLTNTEPEISRPAVAEIESTEVVLTNEPVKASFNKVDSQHLVSAEDLKKIGMDFKCVSQVEVELCQSFNLSAPYGVTQRGIDLFVFAPASLDEELRKKWKRLHNSVDNSIAGEVFIINYLLALPPVLPDTLDDFRIHLYLQGDENQILGSASFYAEGYEEFRKSAPPELLTLLVQGGLRVLEFSAGHINYHQAEKP